MFDIPLSQHVTEMKRMGEMLVPVTYPKVPFRVEQDILVLKQRVFIVDGYEVSVTYSKADYYNEYFLESLQIQGACTPFLPFVVVCKIGKYFFGTDNLAYIEFFKGVKKVYCWSIRTKNNQIIPPGDAAKLRDYEGFSFHILREGALDLI